MERKPRAGTEFERLIARIEKTFAPKGAIVKSPDYIQDKVTGRMREVDVSVKIPEGTSIRLITVECRDHRKGRQNDTWIEQIITKREKIGAWRTIAVSSSGFSRSAIITAQRYGVELRTLDQITDAEIAQQWYPEMRIEVIVIEYEVLRYRITDSSAESVLADELSVELREEFYKDPLNTPFLLYSRTNETLSASQLTSLVETPEAMEENGDPVFCTITLNASPQEWYVETVAGQRDISQVEVDYRFSKRSIPAPIQEVRQYSSHEETLAHFVKAKTADEEMRRFHIEVKGRFRDLPTPEKKGRGRAKTAHSLGRDVWRPQKKP